MQALSIQNISNNLKVSYNTAKKMVIDVKNTGTNNIIQYHKTFRILNMELFIMELNNMTKLKQEKIWEKKNCLLQKTKKQEYIMQTLQLTESDVDRHLKQLLN